MSKKKRSKAPIDPDALPPPPEPPKPVDRDPKWIWPPFPKPPKGVTIVPFSEFQPKGIIIALEDDTAELDANGVATVPLLVKHGDRSRRKSKKKRDPLAELSQEELNKMTWDKRMELGEDMRMAPPIDPNMTLVDQFIESTQLFRQNRPWDHSRQQLWDQWRLYTGLISGMKKPHGKKTPNYEIDDERPHTEDPGIEEDGSDEENMEMESAELETVISEVLPTINKDEEAKRKKNEETYQKLLAAREERPYFWVNETEKATKIFFSSYFRDKGLMWSIPSTRDAPLILRFYLQFVLRNKLFDDKHLMRAYQKSLAIVERAIEELPYTFKMSKVFPDQWGEGCAAVWGSISKGLFGQLEQPVTWTTWSPPSENDDGTKGCGVDDDVDPRGLAKLVQAEYAVGERRIVEHENPAHEEATIEEVNNDEPTSMLEDELKESRDFDKSHQEPLEDNDGWGLADAQEDLARIWGTPPGSDDGWGELTIPSLFPIAGPTTIPLQFIPIRAENSTRILVDIRQPDTNSPTILASRLATLVLQPWPTPDDDPDSLVRSPEVIAFGDNDDRVTEARRSARKYDPSKDAINVLVNPDIISECKVGMGIGASWVQVRRIEDEGRAKPPKRSKSDEWWYIEHLHFIVPSFWTPDEEHRDLTRKRNNPDYAYDVSD